MAITALRRVFRDTTNLEFDMMSLLEKGFGKQDTDSLRADEGGISKMDEKKEGEK